ncbi:MAG: F0F1 ATP synthase subunit A [Clostridiales bacterium]|nr:F0F1 ATP synthase subunit A [Clostridiales bacterium]
MNVVLAASWGQRFWEAFVEEIKDVFGIYLGRVNIGEEIREAILQWKGYLSVGGNRVPITDAIIIMWIAVLAGGLLFYWMGSKREMVPTGRQALMESLIGLLFGVCKDYGLNDKQAEAVVPMIGTMGIFIISCNLIAVFHLPPPAKNIAFPFALAIFAITYVIVMSIRFVGLKGLGRSFTDPKGFMVPFKIIDFFIKPVSLALRLFGNVFGAFILMEFVGLVLPIFLPGTLSIWFDLMDGILQAIVFCYLTTSYIGEVVESAHAVEERKQEMLKQKAEKEAAAKTAVEAEKAA